MKMKINKRTALLLALLALFAALILASCDLVINQSGGTTAGADTAGPADTPGPDDTAGPADALSADEILAVFGGEWLVVGEETQYLRTYVLDDGTVILRNGYRDVSGGGTEEAEVIYMKPEGTGNGRYSMRIKNRDDDETLDITVTVAESGDSMEWSNADGEKVGMTRRPQFEIIDTMEFLKRDGRTWTAPDGDFIQFSDSAPEILFNWWMNIEGILTVDFPVGEVTEVRRYGSDAYELTVLLPNELKPLEFNYETGSDGIRFGLVGTEGKLYTDSEESPLTTQIPEADFTKTLEGLWFDSGFDNYFYFYQDNHGRPSVFCGNRSSEEKGEYYVVNAAMINRKGNVLRLNVRDPGNTKNVKTIRVEIVGIGSYTLKVDLYEGSGEEAYSLYKGDEIWQVSVSTYYTVLQGTYMTNDGDVIQFYGEYGTAFIRRREADAAESAVKLRIVAATEILGGSRDREDKLVMLTADGSPAFAYYRLSSDGKSFEYWENEGDYVRTYHLVTRDTSVNVLYGSEIGALLGGVWLNSGNDDYFFFYQNDQAGKYSYAHFGNRSSEDKEVSYSVVAALEKGSYIQLIVYLNDGHSRENLQIFGISVDKSNRMLSIDMDDGRGYRSYSYIEADELREIGPATYSNLHPGVYMTRGGSILYFYGHDNDAYLRRWLMNGTGNISEAKIIRSTLIRGGPRDGEEKLVMRMTDTGKLVTAYLRYSSNFTSIEFWEEGGSHEIYAFYSNEVSVVVVN